MYTDNHPTTSTYRIETKCSTNRTYEKETKYTDGEQITLYLFLLHVRPLYIHHCHQKHGSRSHLESIQKRKVKITAASSLRSRAPFIIYFLPLVFFFEATLLPLFLSFFFLSAFSSLSSSPPALSSILSISSILYPDSASSGT